MAENLTAQLGLGNPSQSWQATRDGHAEYANLLSLISATLGKMGQDVSQMAQQDIYEITLSGNGSS